MRGYLGESESGTRWSVFSILPSFFVPFLNTMNLARRVDRVCWVYWYVPSSSLANCAPPFFSSAFLCFFTAFPFDNTFFEDPRASHSTHFQHVLSTSFQVSFFIRFSEISAAIRGSIWHHFSGKKNRSENRFTPPYMKTREL